MGGFIKSVCTLSDTPWGCQDLTFNLKKVWCSPMLKSSSIPGLSAAEELRLVGNELFLNDRPCKVLTYEVEAPVCPDAEAIIFAKIRRERFEEVLRETWVELVDPETLECFSFRFNARIRYVYFASQKLGVILEPPALSAFIVHWGCGRFNVKRPFQLDLLNKDRGSRKPVEDTTSVLGCQASQPSQLPLIRIDRFEGLIISADIEDKKSSSLVE
jgi:hypothetical protein